jgi:hypothetical protein
MKRIIKNPDSVIVTEGLSYPKDKVRIRELLEKEQQYICAYWEDRITASSSIDVEHFNPLLKETSQDSYDNWFAVCHRANLMKGTKNADSRWEQHQLLIDPTHTDLEQRICYDKESGDYFGIDTAAQNLVDYLNLNDHELREDRIDYEVVINDYIRENGIEWTTNFLKRNRSQVRFRRILEIIFDIQL